MATDYHDAMRPPISPRALWFGLGGSAAAWLLLGFIDILITWRACISPEPFAGTGPHSGTRAIYIIAAIILFAVVVIAGTISYRNWQALSQQREILQTTATDRREFMALLGVFVSLTLGFGVLWLAIPPLIVELCMRAR